MKSTAQAMPQPKASTLFPILAIGLLFFIFGFITWLNGALIPFLQMVCELTEIQALFIAFCFYFAYVVMALPMAKILEHTGYQKGMALGLLIIASGCLIFIPAALSKTFWVFLLAQFVVGSGLTILQTASNPFIVLLGEKDGAAARIAFMGLLNKAAGALAPAMFTALVLGSFASVTPVTLAEMSPVDRAQQIESMSYSLIQPYIGMAVVLGVLAFVFNLISLPDIDGERANEAPGDLADAGSVLQFPQLVLGAIGLFFYVGVEVIAGDTIGLYGNRLGLANATAFTSFTMTAMVVGYILGLLFIPRFVSQRTALTLSALLGAVLTLLIVLSSNTSTAISSVLWGWASIQTVPDSIALIALLGLANAMVWPAIWPLALDGLGKHTAKGSAILIMGIAGGAVLPMVYGGVAEWIDNQSAYLVMLPCYAFILYYALVGHSKRSW